MRQARRLGRVSCALWVSILALAGGRACSDGASIHPDARGGEAEIDEGENVDAPPSMRITSPEANSEVEGLVTVTAEVHPEQLVRAVDFYIDGELVGEDDAPPYEKVWDASRVHYGTRHAVRATARPRDADSPVNPLAQDVIQVVVVSDWPPLRFEAPRYGEEVSGQVGIRVIAQEELGQVTVTLGGFPRTHLTGTGPVVSGTWSTCDADEGDVTLQAEATDPLGQTWRASVDVHVNNLDTPPVLRGTPAPGAARLEWDACGFFWSAAVYWRETPGVSRSSYSFAVGGHGTALHEGREPGWTYYYRVASTDGDRVGALSNEVAVTAVPPIGEGCSPDGWCREAPGAQEHSLKAVWAASRAQIWAVGGEGTILRGDGVAWQPIPSGLDLDSSVGDLVALWGTAADDVWVVGPPGTVLHWDGVVWQASEGHAASFEDIWGTAHDDVWAVGSGTVVHWDGVAWTTHAVGVSDHHLSGVWASGPDDVWAVGSDRNGTGGALLHWDGSRWSYESSGPDDRLESVWGSGPEDVWAVGRLGRILHWDGALWQPVDAGVVENLAAVHGTGPDEVWAVGDRGVVLRWDGEGWRRLEVGTDRPLCDVWALAPDDVWVVGERGAMRHWNGSGWSGRASGPTVALGDVGGAAGVAPLAVGDLGVVLQRDDEAWQALRGYSDGVGLEDTVPIVDLYALHGSGADDVWAVGSAGAVARWNGTSWRSVETGSSAALHGVWVGTPDRAWAVGADGVALHWHGGRWDSHATGAKRTLRAVWGAADDDVWAGGFDGLYHWDGTRWQATETPADGIDALWGSGPDDVWAVGQRGLILHYDGAGWAVAREGERFVSGIAGSGPDDVWVFCDDHVLRWDGARWTTTPWDTPFVNGYWVGSPDDAWVSAAVATYHWDGTTWEQHEPPTDRYILDVWGAGGEVWLCGEQGLLAHWGSTAWELAVPEENTADLHGVWVGDADDIWAVGDHGVTVHWDGAAWQPEPTGTDLPLYRVGGSASDDVWTVGQAGVALHWDGNDWRPIPSGTDLPLVDVWAATPGAAWAVGGYQVFRWDGTAWTSAHTLGFLEPPLSAVWGTDTSDVWAVGGLANSFIGGVVVHWDGAEWTPVPDELPFAPLFDVHGDRRGNVWAVGEHGIAEHWDGERWTRHVTGTLDPLYGVWTDGENTWAVGHGGVILRHRYVW